MDNPNKFLLPSPNFNKKALENSLPKPHFLTPSGMTMHIRQQPPPMYGKRGPTYPSRYLPNFKGKITEIKAIPDNEQHMCEACDMELQTVDDLHRHRSQHEPCPVDGCKYRGHPSVMDKHVTTLHASGLFEKFKKLSTPEEIASWREERRRKYPSVENVLQKQRAHEQRQKRGERLEVNKSRFGKIEDRKRARGDNNPNKHNALAQSNNSDNINKPWKGKKRRRRPEFRTSKEAKQELCAEQEKPEETEETGCGVMMFKGTKHLKDYEHMKIRKREVGNVLSTLLGMYGSDEDDSDYGDAESPIIEDIPKAALSKKTEEVQPIFNACLVAKYSENLQKIETKEVENNVELQKLPGTSMSTNILNKLDATEEINASSVVENGSNRDSSDESPVEAPIERKTDASTAYNTQILAVQNVEIASTSSKSEQCTKAAKLKCKSGLNYRNIRLRKQNTMLQKLLESDIRHERNVLLQCVRHVCENNFFNIGQRHF